MASGKRRTRKKTKEERIKMVEITSLLGIQIPLLNGVKDE
jgi:hypothetical protein